MIGKRLPGLLRRPGLCIKTAATGLVIGFAPTAATNLDLKMEVGALHFQGLRSIVYSSPLISLRGTARSKLEAGLEELIFSSQLTSDMKS
jgi:hypothetical protein